MQVYVGWYIQAEFKIDDEDEADAKLCPNGHDVGNWEKFCSQCGSKIITEKVKTNSYYTYYGALDKACDENKFMDLEEELYEKLWDGNSQVLIPYNSKFGYIITEEGTFSLDRPTPTREDFEKEYSEIIGLIRPYCKSLNSIMGIVTYYD